MNRRLFVRLACSVIVGLSLHLPLGQTDYDLVSDSGAGDKILADVREMIKILSAEEKTEYGPYVVFWSDGRCQWIGYSEDTGFGGSSVLC